MDADVVKYRLRTGPSVIPAQVQTYITYKEHDGTQKGLKLKKNWECRACDFYFDEANDLEAHLRTVPHYGLLWKNAPTVRFLYQLFHKNLTNANDLTLYMDCKFDEPNLKSYGGTAYIFLELFIKILDLILFHNFDLFHAKSIVLELYANSNYFKKFITTCFSYFI